MDSTEKQIIDAVDAQREDLIEFFRELVREKSYTGNERSIANKLVAGLKKRGLTDIEIVGSSPEHPNVLAHIRGRKNGPTYTFNGHMDVIAPQEEDRWEHKPFSADYDNGRIYGRGTVDMKGGTFGSFFAGLIFSKLDIPIRGNVLFTAVCDEEICGDNGTKWLIRNGYIKKEREDDFGINCEPTDLTEMNIVQKGTLRTDVIVQGKGVFGARPYLGISAINWMSRFIDEVIKLNERINHDELRRHELLEPPNVLATLIKGGEATNLLPDRCTVTLTRRMNPGETRGMVLNEYQEIIDRVHAENPAFCAKLNPWDGFRPPMELPRDAYVIDSIRKALRLIRSTELQFTGSEGGTDASLVVNQTGIQMPIYGPGDFHLLGTPHEYIFADDFIDAIKIYALSIYYTLGVRENN